MGTALVTGGSRGIGAEAAIGLARRGYDIVITYRNKVVRAEEVAERVRGVGQRCVPIRCDMTVRTDVAALAEAVRDWAGRLDILVLNASGGLERDLVAADPEYPWRINRDAQVAVLEAVTPQMRRGGVVVFVTSHWAHLYGQVPQLPAYEPVAASKRAGEDAMWARQTALMARGIRLVVVTGDLVEGTITPRLLERVGPGMTEHRRSIVGGLPSTEEMGEAIAAAATDTSLIGGETIVVGGTLESLRAH